MLDIGAGQLKLIFYSIFPYFKKSSLKGDSAESRLPKKALVVATVNFPGDICDCYEVHTRARVIKRRIKAIPNY